MAGSGLSGGMTVTPEVLVGSAQSIDTAAARLASGVDELQAAVTSRSPWGADEPGNLFGAAYVAVLGHALQTFASHVDLLGHASQGLVDWAAGVVTVEAGVASDFTRISAAL
jgi:hypothetical protein